MTTPETGAPGEKHSMWADQIKAFHEAGGDPRFGQLLQKIAELADHFFDRNLAAQRALDKALGTEGRKLASDLEDDIGLLVLQRDTARALGTLTQAELAAVAAVRAPEGGGYLGNVLLALTMMHTASAGPESERPDWLVWAIEHKMWWKADSRGYTTDLAKAGRYTHSRAMQIQQHTMDCGVAQAAVVPVPPGFEVITFARALEQATLDQAQGTQTESEAS